MRIRCRHSVSVVSVGGVDVRVMLVMGVRSVPVRHMSMMPVRDVHMAPTAVQLLTLWLLEFPGILGTSVHR